MIPIIDTTVLSSIDTEGLRNTPVSGSQGTAGGHFGDLLNTAGESSAAILVPSTRPGLEATASGDILPGGGKHLPPSETPLLETLPATSPLQSQPPELLLSESVTAQVDPGVIPAQPLPPDGQIAEEVVQTGDLPATGSQPSALTENTPVSAAPLPQGEPTATELEAGDTPVPVIPTNSSLAQLEVEPATPTVSAKPTEPITPHAAAASATPGAAITTTVLPETPVPAVQAPAVTAPVIPPANTPMSTTVTASGESPSPVADLSGNLKPADGLPARAEQPVILREALEQRDPGKPDIARAEPGLMKAASNPGPPPTVAAAVFSTSDTGLPPGMRNAAIPSMTTPIGDPNWNTELSARVGLMVKNGMSEASLQLNPAELGRLEIKISTEGDQAKVLFNVQNASTREAIEQAMPRLRDMLGQEGLQLAQADVADHSQHHVPQSELAPNFTDAELDEEEVATAQHLSTASNLSVDSLVDYYV